MVEWLFFRFWGPYPHLNYLNAHILDYQELPMTAKLGYLVSHHFQQNCFTFQVNLCQLCSNSLQNFTNFANNDDWANQSNFSNHYHRSFS